MSTEATFPADAMPGGTPSDAPKIETASAAEPKPVDAATDTGNTRRWQVAGVGAAIGSAAIVAALLYANRSKRD